MMVERGIYPCTICSTHPRANEEEHDQSDRFAAAAGSAHALVHSLFEPRRCALSLPPARMQLWASGYEDQAHFPLPHELGGLIENPDAYLREHGVADGEEPTGEYAAARLLSRAEAELSEYFERKRTFFYVAARS